MNVLFIDDEEEFLELMQNRLSKRGFTVSTANSGETGLALVDKQPFDVVVLDVKMPGCDGVDVLRQLKQRHPDLAVLLLSGHASTDVAMTSIENGAADYMLKPVPLNDLIVRLRDIANRNS